MNIKYVLTVSISIFLVIIFITTMLNQNNSEPTSTENINQKQNNSIKSDKYWEEKLTSEQYKIMRKKGTEPPFSSQFNDIKKEGVFVTADTGLPVFKSEHKFDSGTGWPSFYAPYNEENIELIEDNSLGLKRTEVVSKDTGAHLGHVFDDGPEPTGLRYCINGNALKFIPINEWKETSKQSRE